MYKIAFLILLSFVSCNRYNSTDEESLQEISKSKKIISYIEANDKTEYISSKNGGFGDIILYDLETNRKYSVTNDNHYEEYLSFSPDGKKLLFTSTRDNSYSLNRKSDYRGFNKLFYFDLESNEIKNFRSKLYVIPNVRNFIGLSWSQNAIYFEDEKKIYKLKDSGDSIKSLLNLEDFFSTNLSVSPDSKHIVISYHLTGRNSTEFRLGLMNLAKDSLYILKQQQERFVYSGGWSPDGKSFLFFENLGEEYGLFIYNIESKLTRKLSVPGLGDDFLLSDYCFVNSKEIVMICFKDYDQHTESDVALFNLETGSFKFITENKKHKRYLAVWSPELYIQTEKKAKSIIDQIVIKNNSKY